MIYLVAACLIAIWCHIAVANWRVMVSKSTMWRNSSLIPMVGGFFGAAGFALVPALRPWAWVPILLDPGTAMLPVALPYLLRDFWQTSRFNLVTEYAGRRDNRTVRLALYRRNVGTLVQRIDRPPDEFGWTERSMSGSWRWKGDRLELNIGGRVAIFEPVPGAAMATIRQTEGFPTEESDPDLSLAGIDLVGRSNDSDYSMIAAMNNRKGSRHESSNADDRK